jgi:plasmid stability protein
MFCTCNYVLNMSKMIQIRHVPDALHRKLRSRAALSGMSLSDYLKGELESLANRLSATELQERLSALGPMRVRETPAEAVRAERESR